MGEVQALAMVASQSDHREAMAKQVQFLPDPFTAKAVTRDTCMVSGVDARALARIGGVAYPRRSTAKRYLAID